MILYLDSSALVKLYVEETHAGRVRQATADADVVCCHAIGQVEIRSAFARRRREGAITSEDFNRVRKRFLADWAALHVVSINDAILERAGSFVEKHGLRAYDSVHLAAALEVHRSVGNPALFRFLSFDTAQVDAAVSEGLTLFE